MRQLKVVAIPIGSTNNRQRAVATRLRELPQLVSQRRLDAIRLSDAPGENHRELASLAQFAFQRDVAAEFQLASGNDTIIFTDVANDPFNNDDGDIDEGFDG